MTHAMTPIVLLPLLASPLLLGGREGAAAQAAPTIIECGGALEAADVVLNSLQNWSAPGLSGASWIAVPNRDYVTEAAIRRADGGAPPRVHVDSIAVELRGDRAKKDTFHFQVALELHIRAQDELVVAASMLESFCEKMDKHNGELGVRIGDTRIDSATRTLHVPRLLIELPASEPIEPCADLSRPLSEIVRRVSAGEGQLGNLQIDVSPRGRSVKRVERHLELLLSSDDASLTVESCGAFLHRLGAGEAAIPITRLSLATGKSKDDELEGWMLRVTLLIGGESQLTLPRSGGHRT